MKSLLLLGTTLAFAVQAASALPGAAQGLKWKSLPAEEKHT